MKDFIKLIKSMPVNEHAISSKKETWNKCINLNSDVSNIIINFFGEKKSIQLSRSELNDIARRANGDYVKLIIATLLWGYSSGMRGNNFEKIISNIKEINQLLNEARAGITDWNSHYEKVIKIDGLGLSTYTKFLYFIGAKVHGYSSLILNKKIITVINLNTYQELSDLVGIEYPTAHKSYVDYLNAIHSFSVENKVKEDQVEMFLSFFGQNLKLVIT